MFGQIDRWSAKPQLKAQLKSHIIKDFLLWQIKLRFLISEDLSISTNTEISTSK